MHERRRGNVKIFVQLVPATICKSNGPICSSIYIIDDKGLVSIYKKKINSVINTNKKNQKVSRTNYLLNYLGTVCYCYNTWVIITLSACGFVSLKQAAHFPHQDRQRYI